MQRTKLIEFVSSEILIRKDAARPLLVGIDGRCAAGKTMLADELATRLAVQNSGLTVLRPSVDGFHHSREHRYRQGEFSALGYYEDAFDYRTLIDAVLAPLSGGGFPVLCKQVAHDWRTDLPEDAPAVSVGTNTVMLFDGIFVFRQEINAYWNLRILVDVDAETSIARAIGRDAAALGDPEIAEKKYRLRYEPAWQIYVEAEHPEAKADFRIANGDVLDPHLSGFFDDEPEA